MTPREHYQRIIEKDSDIREYFELNKKEEGNPISSPKIITDTETRLEIYRSGCILVVRPWGWTWYTSHGMPSCPREDPYEIFRSGDAEE